MKLGLLMSAVAALGAVACGGDGRLVVGGCDPADPYCPPGSSSGSYGGSSSSGGYEPYDAGATSHDSGRAEASVGEDGGGASSSVDAGGRGSSSVDAGGGTADADAGGGAGSGEGDGQASGSPRACVPGSACGGLWECTDNCYTSQCCVLDCSCTDPSGASGTLDCALTCP